MKLDYKKESKFFATVALGAGVFTSVILALGNVNVDHFNGVYRTVDAVSTLIQTERNRLMARFGFYHF